MKSRKNFVEKERVADKETIHNLCVKGVGRRGMEIEAAISSGYILFSSETT